MEGTLSAANNAVGISAAPLVMIRKSRREITQKTVLSLDQSRCPILSPLLRKSGKKLTPRRCCSAISGLLDQGLGWRSSRQEQRTKSPDRFPPAPSSSVCRTPTGGARKPPPL